MYVMSNFKQLTYLILIFMILMGLLYLVWIWCTSFSALHCTRNTQYHKVGFICENLAINEQLAPLSDGQGNHKENS